MKRLFILFALGLTASLSVYPQGAPAQSNGSFPVCNVTNINTTDIVYRNYPNLFVISAPGVTPDQLSVVGIRTSVKRQADKWIVCPTDSLATTCRIVVRVNTPNGPKPCGERSYRIEDLPAPFAYLSYYSDAGKKQFSDEEKPTVGKAVLLNPKCRIEAGYLNDISRPMVDFRVTSFQVRLPNGDQIMCNGNSFSPDVLQRIEELPSESLIYIHSISVQSKEQSLTQAHPFCVIIN